MEVPMPISCSEDPSLPIKKRQVFTGLSNLVQKFGFWIKNNILLTMTILSVGIGLVLGIILRQFDLSSTLETVIAFPGQIFMQMLKLLILPLIIFSLISSLAQMDAKKSGRMGIIAVSYYFTTATLATIVSITLVLLIHPGNPKMKENHIVNTTTHANVSPLNSIFDLIRNMFPDNIIRATFQKIQSSSNSSSSGGDDDGSTEYIWGMNVLGIIVFCSALGISLSQLGEQAKHVVNIFVILERAVMNLIKAVMWFAPVGIISLIAGNLIELDDLSRTAEGLMLYLLTILAGLMIHWLITTPILYIILTRKNPLIVARTMLQAFFTALGTSSSGAALPISINSMETKMKIDKRIARFILPLGNTVNVDGNALYEAVAVIFIAQMNNMHLSLPQVITISITTTLASMGTGSVPIGLLPVLLVLNSIGLPVSDVTLLFTVDWLIDRIRTAINVMGDGFTTAIVSHHLGDQLSCIEEETEMSEECSVNKNDANDMKGLLTTDLNELEIGCHDKKFKSKNVV